MDWATTTWSWRSRLFPPRSPLTPSVLLCDRHLGVGSDGILLRCPPTGAVPGAVTRMRIFNPDGSESEMCGNGIRIFARYLEAAGAVDPGSEFTVETLAGPITPRLLGERHGPGRHGPGPLRRSQHRPGDGRRRAGRGRGGRGAGSGGRHVSASRSWTWAIPTASSWWTIRRTSTCPLWAPPSNGTRCSPTG